MTKARDPRRYGVGWVRVDGVPTCKATSKRRHVDRAAACDELARIVKAAMTGGRRSWKQESGAYPCDECGGWHLTSRPRTGEVVADGADV